MPTQYGFRLFRVRIHRGFKHVPENYASAALGVSPNAVSFSQNLAQVCKAIEGVTRTEVLRYRARVVETESGEGEREDTTPSIRLESYASNGHRVDFTYRFGRKGSHDLAMAATPDLDAILDDKAPANPYRASLYIPRAGDSAILMAETRNRTCPGRDLLRLIGVSGKEIDEQRAEGSQLGWWRFVDENVGDDVQLRRFLKEGEAAGLVMTRHQASSSSGRTSSDVVLRQDGIPAGKLAAAKALVASWAGIDPTEVGSTASAPSGQTPQKQVAALVNVSINSDQFDEVGVAWEGPDGSTQFYSPESIRDVFIYRVGARGVRPTDSQLRTAAESVVRGLAPNLSAELDL